MSKRHPWENKPDWLATSFPDDPEMRTVMRRRMKGGALQIKSTRAGTIECNGVKVSYPKRKWTTISVKPTA